MEGSAWCPLMPQAACCALPIACPTRRPSKGRGSLYSAMHVLCKRNCTKRSRRSAHRQALLVRCQVQLQAWEGRD